MSWQILQKLCHRQEFIRWLHIATLFHLTFPRKCIQISHTFLIGTVKYTKILFQHRYSSLRTVTVPGFYCTWLLLQYLSIYYFSTWLLQCRTITVPEYSFFVSDYLPTYTCTNVKVLLKCDVWDKGVFIVQILRARHWPYSDASWRYLWRVAEF